jgi:hypothetical protein
MRAFSLNMPPANPDAFFPAFPEKNATEEVFSRSFRGLSTDSRTKNELDSDLRP